jgi:hypothetical protein
MNCYTQKKLWVTADAGTLSVSSECESPPKMIPRFRKRPVEIEAIEFTGENHAEIEQAFLGLATETVFHWDSARIKPRLCISTPEGVMTAAPGDWIIRTSNGAFYPCEADLFAATYEAIPE